MKTVCEIKLWNGLFAHVKVEEKEKHTFGRCTRPSKPHWIHLSNYGTRVIELTTNHTDKHKTNVEAKWIRRSRVEHDNDYKLSLWECLTSHNLAVVHVPGLDRSRRVPWNGIKNLETFFHPQKLLCGVIKTETFISTWISVSFLTWFQIHQPVQHSCECCQRNENRFCYRHRSKKVWRRLQRDREQSTWNISGEKIKEKYQRFNLKTFYLAISLLKHRPTCVPILAPKLWPTMWIPSGVIFAFSTKISSNLQMRFPTDAINFRATM